MELFAFGSHDSVKNRPNFFPRGSCCKICPLAYGTVLLVVYDRSGRKEYALLEYMTRTWFIERTCHSVSKVGLEKPIDLRIKTKTKDVSQTLTYQVMMWYPLRNKALKTWARSATGRCDSVWSQSQDTKWDGMSGELSLSSQRWEQRRRRRRSSIYRVILF